MNQRKRYFYLLLSISVLFVSCIRDADNIDLPESKAKLVIGCFISPQDTVLVATVKKSTPLGTEVHYDDNVKDALVVLSDGVSSVNLIYNSFYSQYEIASTSLSILPGKTYYLSVASTDGLNAKATCTIPPDLNTSLNVLVDSTEKTGHTSDYIYYIKPDWMDIPGQTNYYRLIGEFVFKYSYSTHSYTSGSSPFYDDFTQTVFSDHNQDGQKISKERKESQSYSYFSPGGTYEEKYISVGLLTIDKNYYDYYLGRNNYSEGPFTEPSNINSNIEGGLGVFAGFQIHRIKIDLR